MLLQTEKPPRTFVAWTVVINELPLTEICSWDYTHSGAKVRPAVDSRTHPLEDPNSVSWTAHLRFWRSATAHQMLHSILESLLCKCSWDYNLLLRAAPNEVRLLIHPSKALAKAGSWDIHKPSASTGKKVSALIAGASLPFAFYPP